MKSFPLVVVGGGHAGCEAALIGARKGVETLLITMDLSTIALMPCNPSIGGPGKGHLVREIGALGGEMARAIDETCIQIKWLNTTKGPAVRARRAQADKDRYRDRMHRLLFSLPNLTVRQGHVTEILVRNASISGVRLETGVEFGCERLILATGTYLSSRIIIGKNSRPGGPHNQRPSVKLSDSLSLAGLPLRRLQTATPPRIHRGSIRPSEMQILGGDSAAGGFLWENRLRLMPEQSVCYLTFTNEKTLEVVRHHLPNSPLVLGNITNVGPKHCPSIDRKVLKFPDQVKHQIFVEPEGANSEEMYLQGLTTSMPPLAQREIVQSVAGLENAHILRYGYAIEYDALAPGAIKKTMASRHIGGLYTAGQINGSSGYEEAACQGLIAGINAVLSLRGEAPYIPSRTQGYLGVLIDDLSTWDHPEPYRMTPANAEFRLNLREDTAEKRFIEDGYSLNLVSNDSYKPISNWLNRIYQELQRLTTMKISPTPFLLEALENSGTGGLKKQVTAFEILQRPTIRYCELSSLLGESFSPILSAKDEIEALETEVRYHGYAIREQERMKQTRFLERISFPLPISETSMKILSEETQILIKKNTFDDLNQFVRKHCLSRGEIAILLSLTEIAGAK